MLLDVVGKLNHALTHIHPPTHSPYHPYPPPPTTPGHAYPRARTHSGRGVDHTHAHTHISQCVPSARQLTLSRPLCVYMCPCLSNRCKGVVYCNRGCQKLHWSEAGGNHKSYCRPAPQPGQQQPPQRQPPVAGVVRGGRGGGGSGSTGDCTICLSSDAHVIQRGCCCRGDSGWIHLECMVELAIHTEEHAEEPQNCMKGWWECGTCKQGFTGPLGSRPRRHVLGP